MVELSGLNPRSLKVAASEHGRPGPRIGVNDTRSARRPFATHPIQQLELAFRPAWRGVTLALLLKILLCLRR
jgi:hypothetical protein